MVQYPLLHGIKAYAYLSLKEPKKKKTETKSLHCILNAARTANSRLHEQELPDQSTLLST